MAQRVDTLLLVLGDSHGRLNGVLEMEAAIVRVNALLRETINLFGQLPTLDDLQELSTEAPSTCESLEQIIEVFGGCLRRKLPPAASAMAGCNGAHVAS